MTSGGTVLSPAVQVTADLVATLVERGGYTHPLFHDTAVSRGLGSSPPLPGQAVLLLAGGLVEQSGALERAVALVELREVRFLRMVRAGDVLHVSLIPGDGRATRGGRLVRNDGWTVLDAAGHTVLQATAVMLMESELMESEPEEQRS